MSIQTNEIKDYEVKKEFAVYLSADAPRIAQRCIENPTRTYNALAALWDWQADDFLWCWQFATKRKKSLVTVIQELAATQVQAKHPSVMFELRNVGEAIDIHKAQYVEEGVMYLPPRKEMIAHALAETEKRLLEAPSMSRAEAVDLVKRKRKEEKQTLHLAA
jgi:hypothetical protein